MANEVESIGLSMDTSGIDKGIKALDVLAGKGAPVEKAMAQVEGAAKKTAKSIDDLANSAPKAVDSVGKTAAKTADGLSKVGGAADSAAKSVKNIGANTAQLDRLSSSSTASAISIKSLGAAAVASEKGVQQFVRSVSSVAQSIAAEAASMNDARAAAAAYSAQHIAAAKAMVDLQRSLSATTAAMDGMTAKAKEMAAIDIAGRNAAAGVREVKGAADESNASMLALARAGVSAFVGSAIVRGAKDAAMAMYEASASAQRLQTMLDFASGGNGAREIEYLRKVTNSLGLQFSSTAAAYGQFQAAAKGTALEGQKAAAVFESVAKASAVMGLRADQTSGVLLALQQMISKGTVQAEELRGQLGERLPGAFQIAARAMGVTTAELGKMLEQGQVVAEDFLPKFGKALEENLGGAAEKAADRLDAAVNRFDTAWERLKKNSGDSGASQFWSGQLAILTDAMDGVSVSMELARAQGKGFASQMLAGAGAALQFINPVQAIGYTAIETGNQLKQAEKSLDDLRTSGAKGSSNLMLREAYAHAERLVEKLRQAKKEQDALLGGPQVYTEGMGNSPVVQRQNRERSAFQSEMDKYLSDNSRQTRAQMREEEIGKARKRNAELIAKAEGDTNAVLQLQAALKTEISNIEEKYKDKAAPRASAEANAYKSLTESLREKIAAEQAELSGGAKLSENQKLRIKYAEDLNSSLKGISAAQRSVIEGYLDEHKAAEQANVAAREAMKAAQEIAAARNREAAGIDAWIRAQEDAARQSLKSVQDRIHSMEDEARAIELSHALNVSLAEAIELVAIARLEEKQAGFYEGSEGWEAIQREINARRELLGLIGSKEAREANKRAADEAAKDWERTAQTISDTLADYIMGGGKDAAQYLKRLFSTLVLQPIVQVGVGALLGAGPGGQLVSAAMGGAGGGSALLNNAGLVGAGAQAIWGLSAGASTASLVGANAVGMAGGDALGALIAGNGAWAGVGTGAGAAAGSGFMGALSAIPGWGWALAGIGLLGGLLGGLDDSGTPHMGGAAAWSRGQGLRTNLDFLDDQEGLPGYNPNDNIDNQFGSGMPWVQDNEQVRGTLGVMAQTIASTLDSFAKAFGQQAGYDVALGFADDSSKDGSWGALRVALGDRELLNWNDDRESKWAPRIFSDGEQGWKEFTAATAQDMRDVMTEMDIPGWVKDSLEGLGDSFDLDALGAVVTQIGAVNTAFDALSFGVAAFADLTDEARGRLIQESGGLQGFAASASNYYDKFYTDDEKQTFRENALSKELERLGLEMPNTQRGFRELVEAQIALGESGAETAARLMGLSDAAFEVLPAADEATSALRTMADAAKESFGITADTIKGLLDDILENAGSANEARNMGASGFEEMVTSAIFDSLLSNISGLVMAQIVAPLIAGATTSGAVLAAGGATGGAAIAGGGVMGGSASAAGGSVAGQAIAQGGAAAANAMIAGGSAVGSIVGDVLEAARAQMQAVSGLLQDPAFMEMLGELGQGFGNLSADLFNLKGSFGGGITSVSSSFDSAGKSADGLSDALSNLTGTIEEEIKRLRGIMEEASPNKGYDALMADFATTTAAARAGDEDALGKLPGLSKEIEALLPNRATSSSELAQMRGWLAGSLSETLKGIADVKAAKAAAAEEERRRRARLSVDGAAWIRAGRPDSWNAAILEEFLLGELNNRKTSNVGYGLIPGLATGTNYVPEDMLAVIHKGEAVVPKEYNPAAGGQQIVVPQTFAQPFMGGESEVVAELRELRHEVAQLREQNEALALDAQRLRLRQARTQERTEGLIAMQEEKAGA